MPDDRTIVTELGTALGMLPHGDPAEALAARPSELELVPGTWERLSELHRSGRFATEFAAAWGNGRAFLDAPDALRGRRPRLVEWTGGRRLVGDEVVPVDLRVDHVYLVSCKYLSQVIANASPGRLFDGLLSSSGTWSGGDWYQEVAPDAYRRLYSACREATGLVDLPDDPTLLSTADRRRLRSALPGRSYPAPARAAYQELCRQVSTRSAERWESNADSAAARERLVWRLLRIGNAPYFVLGADPRRPLRLRVASPWDWRQAYELSALEIRPAEAGQPRVDWTISYRHRRGPGGGQVQGHVEVRWSHGRFAQPPEAKVYVDTPGHQLPGYFPMDGPDAQPELWD